MNELTIQLSGLTVGLRCRHPYTLRACRDYIAEGEAQLFAQAAQDAAAGGYEEFISLYRSIAGQLPRFGRMVVHGAAISYEDAGLLFIAPSGTGKSTHIKLWRQFFGAQVDIINGDKPIVSVEDGGIYLHGTPWAGKEGWQKNRSAPLKAICLLRRGKTNRIRKADPLTHLPALMRQVYLPTEAEALQQTLALVDQLSARVPFYILECNISPEAAEAAFSGMREAIL